MKMEMDFYNQKYIVNYIKESLLVPIIIHYRNVFTQWIKSPKKQSV